MELGIVSSVITVIEVALRATSALQEYTTNTRNASTDRKLLAEETQSLSDTLEILRIRMLNARPDDPWLKRRTDLVRQFSRAHDDLIKTLKLDGSTGWLKPESKGKAPWNVAIWSFTKAEVYSLLDRLHRMQQCANTFLQDVQHQLVERIDQRQQDLQAAKQNSAILEWLTPLRMAHTHENISRRPEAGSGRWFITSLEFRKWQESLRATLWCPGIPGAGKTVLACIVADYLRHKQFPKEIYAKQVGLAIIYLKYNDSQQTVESVLGSILVQLVESLDSIPTPLQSLYEKHQAQKSSASPKELAQLLRFVLALFKRVYVIVDALDECIDDMRWELMDCLRSLEDHINLLVTSRFLDTINKELEDFARLEIKANKADLEIFINQNIQKNKNLRRVVEKSPPLKEDIRVAVVRIAEDMFLLARLHVESLGSAAALSIKHVRKRLQSLPTTLNETYDVAMQRIEAQEYEHRQIAMKTLAWVSYAFRPLTLRELQHALAIEPESIELDEEDIVDANSITALCAGLVVVDQGTNMVNLVHYTAKNYFENIHLDRFPGFHAIITMTCATYLALAALRNASVSAIVQRYPLACYAAQYMGDHARHHPEDTLESSVLEVIYELLSHPEKRKPLLSLLDSLDLIKSGFYSDSWIEKAVGDTASMGGITEVDENADNDDENNKTLSGLDLGVDPVNEQDYAQFKSLRRASSNSASWSANTLRHTSDDESAKWKSSGMPEVTALHLAASMGLARVAALLVKESGDIDAVDDTGKTALVLAMERGFEKAVEFLVNSGAKVDLGSEHGQNIFLLVVEKDWKEVSAILLQKNRARLSGLNESESTSAAQLLLAAYSGTASEIENIACQGKHDLRQQDHQVGATALFLAIERKHLPAAQSLLELGVDPNAKDSMSQFPLHRAVRRGHEGIIRLLLRHGAEIDCQNDDGRTPWSANVRTGDERILKLLLELGADPNTRGHQGVSELYIAAQNGETQVVKRMLDSGTNPSIQTQFYWAPLHWAAYYGHISCVRLLIQAGANLNIVSDQDASPLDLAIRNNQDAIVGILSKAGAKESRYIDHATKVQDTTTHSSPDQEQNTTNVSIKISLTFDKPIQQGMNVGQYIYPSNLLNPKDYIYQISQPLHTTTSTLGVRLSKRRADMIEYPLPSHQFDFRDSLYDINRVTGDYQQLELRSGVQGAFAGTISMIKDWTGGWKVRHNHDGESDYLFRTTPDWAKMKEEGCQWMTEDRKLLARTGIEDVTPILCFEDGLERALQDVLLSCWVGKLWSETVALQKRDGDNAPPRPLPEVGI